MTTTPRGAKKESHIRSPSIPPCHKTRQGRIIAGRLKDLGSRSPNPRTSPPPASPSQAASPRKQGEGRVGYDGVRPAPRVRMPAWALRAGRRWMVEVVIDSIRVSLMSQHRIVILKDIDSERFLPIWIGQSEAEAITVALQEIPIVRPLTH